MVRTQIQLTDEQSRRLKAQAAEQRVSVAELIRRAVDRSLAEKALPDQTELRKRALAASGRFRSGTSDVSIRHDDYLAEIYAE
jgi:hypothetical protein